MIPKISSHELNNVFKEASDKLNTIKDDIDSTKSDIQKKLKIIEYESEYIEYELEKISKSSSTSSDDSSIFVMPNLTLSTLCNYYGCTIMPSFKTTPVNLFNIITSTGEAFYRDVVNVTINNTTNDDYKGILKHDSISGKELLFEEMSSSSTIITMILDTTKAIGSSLFNMIEFDAFLNGSYTIDYIRIYTQENNTNYVEYTNYNDAGKMRILFEKQYNFYKVEFKITSNFNTEVDGVKKYLIGLKHIYFYNAKFETTSKAIAIIESDNYIDIINNDMEIITPNATSSTTIENEDILLYLDYTTDSNGNIVFTSQIEQSTDSSIKTISSNVKKIYAQIPLSKAIIGYRFNISSKVF